MRTKSLGIGLFLLTLATLLLETLDARLLSVLTWYHLSFFAVSLAMLGMAAGAVFVFLHPDLFGSDRAPRALARMTFALACVIPISHVVSLTVPFLPVTDFSVMEVLSVAVSTVAVGLPFALSGIAVTLALTRCGGAIGTLYAVDLIGASCGCLAVVPLLEYANVSSAVLVAGAAAALASWWFYRFAGIRGGAKSVVLALLLIGVAISNTGSGEVLKVIYPKNRQLWLTNSLNAITAWNSHSYVLLQRPGEEPAFLWGPGRGAERFRTRIAWLAIDGEAGTPLTEWDGNAASLEWVSYDVTTLPYYLRRGDVVVIGVGGGRDLLAAIWGRNPSITGVDVNQIMIDILKGSHRDFAKIATRPEVTLVHDDGRAFVTRSGRKFDVIQMSLVDTWAATGAGAFTLSENGLYTIDAWRVFLDHLKPGGILSVSRWFDPRNVSETSRLLALGVAALIDRGVQRPLDHLLLVVRGRIATLMVSTAPFTEEDQAAVMPVVAEREFDLVASSWSGVSVGHRLERIARSRTREELDRATADPAYDYSPPTDGHPYYFNMLKPQAFFQRGNVPVGGALAGNLRATLMLLVLLGVATALVSLIIVWPLLRTGRPPLPLPKFATAMSYFAIIGAAYMLVQIALVQRFSIYLGHPTYTLAIVLFSMLAFTGIGSLTSERLGVAGNRWMRLVPAGTATALVVTAIAVPGTISRTITAGLPARTLVLLLFAAPVSMLLGICFPLGVHLLRQTPTVPPWAWGINGALGVLASILAVAISIWIDIDTNLWIAAGLYLTLTGPLVAMARWTRSNQ